MQIGEGQIQSLAASRPWGLLLPPGAKARPYTRRHGHADHGEAHGDAYKAEIHVD